MNTFFDKYMVSLAKPVNIVIRSWGLEVGRWKLEVGGWRLEVWKMEVGSWKLEDGSWKLPALTFRQAGNLLEKP